MALTTPLRRSGTAPTEPLAARAIADLPGARGARFRESFAGGLFLVPIAIVFVVLYVIPMGQSLWFSLTDFDGYSEPGFIGLDNYASIFRDPSMLQALVFTLSYALATTVLVTAFAIPLALVLNRRFLGRNIVRSVFFFPAVPSVAILGLVWGFILSPLGSGVLNSALDGIAGIAPIGWLSDSTLAQISVIAVAIWAQTGWHAILYLAYLQAIPQDYYEVARIDGATGWQTFRSITLPMLVPAISVSQLLLMTNGLKVYDLPFTLTSGGPGFSTRTLTQSLIESGIAQSRVGQASALAVLFLIVVALVVVVQLAASRRLERRYS
ncbi:multiple sugar transport system permease protein/raffinose/stachyose/melibiose transport system permease protein [Rathayibacter sp. PhB93]|uniref:carbohydrate ABC transporter permease n=1 Tax=unclassified Rathayibacter TaxID=2609250 RepID=UPI000F46C8FE|nr:MULTISPECIES: sugar ABC transporter permease [unclassified Rathayibacter]ROQ05677.1 multiple sugar transport system permease protein/raffinose/stachyose/melibiose transport system permease protein [Rathayibacter sp. PhB93]TDQ12253.1 multiple sugar transport system permease protein/raffinose/stachyose/melibiose transport system permease protein [Rathayibacter sp. PhB1]